MQAKMRFKVQVKLVLLLILLVAYINRISAQPGIEGNEYKVSLPVTINPIPTAPPATISYYIQDTDSGNLFYKGCDLAHKIHLSQDHYRVALLHFGEPWFQNGNYGVLTYAQGYPFISTAEVQEAVYNFAMGYTLCRLQYGVYPVLILGIGVNNQGPYVNANHAIAWSNLMNDTSDMFVGTLVQWKVLPTGAADLEPGFNTPEATLNWVNGFSNTLYNFGTADGCPETEPQGTNPGQCGTVDYPTWTQSHVLTISAGRPGLRIMPEIYAVNGVNARQWHQIAIYHYKIYYILPLTIRGSLTQFGACEQRSTEPGCNLNDPNGAFLKNTPSDGWFQFWNALRSDARTNQYNVPYTSDIQWQIN